MGIDEEDVIIARLVDQNAALLQHLAEVTAMFRPPRDQIMIRGMVFLLRIVV